MANILVSACLIGCGCRYDAAQKISDKVMELAKENTLVPICPEQLGGLPTPRHPSERVGDKVIRDDGIDVTTEYERGAKTAVEIARICKADYCVLKSKSPSCGCGCIYDGTFSKQTVQADGVTTQHLKQAGFKVISELDL